MIRVPAEAARSTRNAAELENNREANVYRICITIDEADCANSPPLFVLDRPQSILTNRFPSCFPLK